jgi:hypothetical protein
MQNCLSLMTLFEKNVYRRTGLNFVTAKTMTSISTVRQSYNILG